MDIPTIEYLKSSPQHICARHIKKKFPDFYKIINEIEGDSFSEKLYIYFFGQGKCMHCGKGAKYINFIEGYAPYCGLSCRSLHTREKAAQTCLKRYGDRHFNNRQKAIQTSIERYGVESWNTIPEKIEKTKQTCRQRYGTSCSFQNERVKEKFKQTCRLRYGVNWYTESPDMVKKSKQTCLERYGVESPAQLKSVREKIKQTCLERYGHPHGPIGYSKKEEALALWIESQGIEVIRNYTNKDISEIDIYIPSLKIGFEFNGVYWHSKEHKPTKYHINKTKQCFQNGILLYHIWEHWDQLNVYEFILHVLGLKHSDKNFDKIFFKDDLIHIDINPHQCIHNVKLKRRMHQSYIYYDSGVIR